MITLIKMSCGQTKKVQVNSAHIVSMERNNYRECDLTWLKMSIGYDLYVLESVETIQSLIKSK